MIRAHPVHMPLFDPPPAWTGFWRECPDRLRVPFVRRDWWPEHRAAIAECFKDPGWEHARGAHALERVPCLIDTTMRDLVDRYAVEVMGRIGQQRRDDEWQVADDIRTAKYIGDRLFYIDRNVDKRGRINSVPHFNFDNRGDHVRSMLRFARGMELDRAEGTQWLEVHCANCNGENGIDKRPWDERINWVARNRELIQKIADDPEGTFELWRGVDSPFCFVAACRELAAAWKDPENFETHLPIGFDGSCNGLQHLALIARDPETAFMVNVGPHPETGVWPRDPQDVYGLVVAETKKLLLADTNPWASWWISRFKDLGDKDTRKLIKTPAMTFAYSVTQGGMRDHIAEVYRTLRCANSHSHYDSSQPEGARDGCSYLAGKIIEACRGLLKEPTRVMEYVQQLAEHRISRGLFLEWVNQSDFPVLHRYHRPKESETINLKTYGVRVRHNLVLAFEDAIWREKTINAAAANLVHSLDAAHLIKVVIHAGKELIRDIITTHDCYYCLAPQATKLNQIIRYEMGEMYRVNVLADLRRRNVDFDILPPPAMVRVIRYEGDVLANRPEPGVRHIPAPAFPELDPLAVNFSEAAFS
jgi:DNA-directed RNA polymerase